MVVTPVKVRKSSTHLHGYPDVRVQVMKGSTHLHGYPDVRVLGMPVT